MPRPACRSEETDSSHLVENNMRKLIEATKKKLLGDYRINAHMFLGTKYSLSSLVGNIILFQNTFF